MSSETSRFTNLQKIEWMFHALQFGAEAPSDWGPWKSHAMLYRDSLWSIAKEPHELATMHAYLTMVIEAKGTLTTDVRNTIVADMLQLFPPPEGTLQPDIFSVVADAMDKVSERDFSDFKLKELEKLFGIFKAASGSFRSAVEMMNDKNEGQPRRSRTVATQASTAEVSQADVKRTLTGMRSRLRPILPKGVIGERGAPGTEPRRTVTPPLPGHSKRAFRVMSGDENENEQLKRVKATSLRLQSQVTDGAVTVDFMPGYSINQIPLDPVPQPFSGFDAAQMGNHYRSGQYLTDNSALLEVPVTMGECDISGNTTLPPENSAGTPAYQVTWPSLYRRPTEPSFLSTEPQESASFEGQLPAARGGAEPAGLRSFHGEEPSHF
ncbi:hypothetical protein QFC21_006669 [Naganishia friedmannii]|uniref:Uncharacterized protein n=1 Tax=Naganishia friedmannii TaxID=89922 RepID=A0ACC2V0S1_9TREE|nr:hypothetical protein QFC21_006669 [Naganishia friedmannii]